MNRYDGNFPSAPRRELTAPTLIALAMLMLVGLWLRLRNLGDLGMVVDEGIQAILPTRVYDVRDVAFNAVAGLLAVSAMVALSWAQRRDADRGVEAP